MPVLTTKPWSVLASILIARLALVPHVGTAATWADPAKVLRVALESDITGFESAGPAHRAGNDPSGNCGRAKVVVAAHESRTLASRGEIMLRDTLANLKKTMAACGQPFRLHRCPQPI